MTSLNAPDLLSAGHHASAMLQTLWGQVLIQDYPSASLFVVATPIGNRGDITLRALHVLQRADVIACEDTRTTRGLLQSLGVHKPPAQWLAVHQHNEHAAAAKVVDHLSMGLRVAYASDAGTPGISDPGVHVVTAAQAAGYRVIPIPGASSISTLFSVSPAMAAGDIPFAFHGFLPARGQGRRQALARMAGSTHPILFLEAPHRMPELALTLEGWTKQHLTVGRELTKQFEEIVTLPCPDLLAWLQAHPGRSKGEFALLLHPAQQSEAPVPGLTAEQRQAQSLLGILLGQGIALKTAVAVVCQHSQQPKNAVYAWALGMRNPSSD